MSQPGTKKLFHQSQLFQIAFNLLVKVGSFGFQLLDFLHHGMDVDRFFFLESIYIARNVEVVVVLGNLLQGGKMTVLFYLLALTIGINNLLDVLWTELVLCLDLFKLFACVASALQYSNEIMLGLLWNVSQQNSCHSHLVHKVRQKVYALFHVV